MRRSIGAFMNLSGSVFYDPLGVWVGGFLPLFYEFARWFWVDFQIVGQVVGYGFLDELDRLVF